MSATTAARRTRTSPKRPDRTHIAYHEAGHAVAAHAFGFPVHSASIIFDAETWGRVVSQTPRWMRDADHTLTPYREIRLHRQIMVALAGAAALALHTLAIHTRRRVWTAAWQDLQDAFTIAGWITGSDKESEALVEWLWLRTKHTLALPWMWRQVDAVAAALLVEQALTAQRVRDIITEAERAGIADLLSTDAAPSKGAATVTARGEGANAGEAR